MVGDFFKKAYGNGVVLINLHGQRRIPFLPVEKLNAIRDARLRGLVRYAATTVPYYRKLFKKEGIDPCEIRSVEDLNQLPLIDKKLLRKDPMLFVSQSPKGRRSLSFTTSGTTGMPLKVYHDQNSLLANIAFSEREREVVSKFCEKPFGYRIALILYPGSTSEKVRDFYRQWTFIPIRPERFTLSVLDPFEDVIEKINHLRPDVLIGYGSYLETFFRILSLRRISIHFPKVLVYGAEAMTDEGRTFIEEKFGIPVLSQYNAVEAFKIGFLCEERRGFHIHEDLCHVKIVDAKGEQVTNGEKGEVVISNFVNHGTVLLNYRLGDIASMSNERCPCGRTLPLLSELEGRVEDILFLPDGRFIHPRAIWGVIKKRDEVLKYQLIQHEPARFELRLVTIDRKIYQQVVRGILADLRDLLGNSTTIESEHNEELRPQEGGKFRSVLSLCKPR